MSVRLKTYGRLSGIKAQTITTFLTFGDPKVITKLTGGERLKVTDRVGPWALVGHGGDTKAVVNQMRRWEGGDSNLESSAGQGTLGDNLWYQRH